MNKGFILKTAAVVSCVVVLGVTGCRGGVDEAAAVKNKGTVSIEIHEAKGEDGLNVISERDREETVEAVDRSNGHEGTDASPPHTNKQDMGDGERPTGYDTQDRDNDTERNEMENRRGQEDKSEAEQPEAEVGITGEEDRGDVDGSTSLGAGEGSENNDTASAVYSVSDMGCGEGRESDSSAGWEWGMEDDTAVPEYWHEPDSAGVEAEEGFTESEPYESESYDDSNEQHGDSEYSEDTSNGWSDGATDNLTYLDIWTVSFYCPCVACTNSGNGITASGTYAQPWHTAATDGLEFGATLYVEGLGYFVVEDRGTSYGWLDIFVSDHNEALALGLQSRAVYLVN